MSEETRQYFSESAIRAIRDAIVDWGTLHYQRFPWRKPKTKWHGLLAEVLLQRTKAKTVVPVYTRFECEYPTPESLAMADLETIEALIYPLGLRWRAPLIQALATQVSNNGLPVDQHALLELPGIGRYAAAAFLSLHCDERAVIVDSNVVRWLCRLVDAPYDGETRRKAWLVNLANELTPRLKVAKYNYALLDFTMQVCTASKPACSSCPLAAELCITGKRALGS